MSLKSRGSEWRKWDLHVHTASSYDYEYKSEDSDKLLVEALRKNGIQVIAITDHFIIDAKRINRIRKLANNEITVFPGVELRTDKGANNIHVILIFDENIPLSELENDFKVIMLKEKAKSKESNDTIYWDYEDIKEFVKKRKGLISIHAGKKTNGLDRNIKNDSLLNMAFKEEYSLSVDIFEVSKKTDLDGYKEKVFKNIPERPVIICSDNHNPREYNIKDYLWIKADKTFEGLKQAVIHSNERVYIGKEPPKLASLKKNPEKYILKIKVKKKDKFTNFDKWFDFDLELNPGLTTVIGNKGSGKSAFSDLIGYIGMSNNQKYFSFLNKNRFAKENKKFNLDYEGEITWFDGEKSQVEDFSLSNTKSEGLPLIRYLPQGYIEEVCNSLDENFQVEIDNVIFSYIDIDKRGNTTNLEELVKTNQYSIIEKIKLKNMDIASINEEIIKLENKKLSSYYNDCKNRLIYWNNELRRHEENKPKPVSRPSKENDKEELKIIENCMRDIDENDKKIKEEMENINKERMCITELNSYKEKISLEIEKIINLKNEGLELSKKYNLEPEIEISVLNTLNGVDSRIEKANINIRKSEELISSSFNGIEKENFDFEKMDEYYKNIKSLYYKNHILKLKINKIKDELDKPEIAYQNYLDEIKSWEEKKNKIIGSDKEKDSLKYAEKEFKYLEEELEKDLTELINRRKKQIEELHNLYLEKKKILDAIYEPVEKKLDINLNNIKDKIKFKSSISMDLDFSNNLLNYINQNINSKYKGKNEGKEFISTLLRTYDDLSNFDNVYSFIEELMDAIYEDKDKVDLLVKKRKECYDYICSLSYLNVGFSLDIGDKNLDKLSPGEKGLVLLIFYLSLDQEEKPLIIDQPEDNLDNQSVFGKLVPCILEAKKNRQIIIVTHNPNLAIACDSELIIYSENNENNINYFSGSIENKEIKNKIVDILEGTMEAFELRNSKYKSLFNKNKIT